jgi:hypothetical protein
MPHEFVKHNKEKDCQAGILEGEIKSCEHIIVDTA